MARPMRDPALQAQVEATLAASRALLGVVAVSMAEVLDKITLPQFRLLVVLRTDGPLRSGALADRLGIHQSTLTRMADRLVAQGWIVREVGAESRREVIVDLTQEGRGLVEQVMTARRAEIGRVLAGAAPEERETIRAGFEAFARAAGEPDPALLLSMGL